MSTPSKTKRARADWRAGFRLADDPGFDADVARRERQLLFEQVKAGEIDGVVVAADMPTIFPPPLVGSSEAATNEGFSRPLKRVTH